MAITNRYHHRFKLRLKAFIMQHFIAIFTFLLTSILEMASDPPFGSQVAIGTQVPATLKVPADPQGLIVGAAL
ncbi:hypothetical protein GH714_004863 [Hevea brasiliensis]|uniref:Uncharacterized protein n=1 Tax=Hevea brasiliensis TaxID=3981 RepID=A0A6A6LH45_HEVBR|nr:hypothetical protein GH714_004863 [Hevea brasiliensis]